MKNYKVNQHLYNKLTVHDDDLNNLDYQVIDQESSDLKKTIIEYFTLSHVKTIFPAKSYAVAIIYAQLLHKYFNEDFYSSLSDEDLFIGTDRYFKSYSKETKEIYDFVIDYIEENNLWDFESSELSHVQKTCDYFIKECVGEL